MACDYFLHASRTYPQKPSPFNMVIFAQEAWRSQHVAHSDTEPAQVAFSWDREDASDISTGPLMTPTHATRSQTPGVRGRETVPNAGLESQSSSRRRSG